MKVVVVNTQRSPGTNPIDWSQCAPATLVLNGDVKVTRTLWLLEIDNMHDVFGVIADHGGRAIVTTDKWDSLDHNSTYTEVWLDAERR